MFSSLLIRIVFVCFTAITIISCPLLVWAQGLQQTPYSSPSLLRGLSGQGLDMAPSNPLRAPGTSGPWSSAGSDSVFLSSAMFQGLLPPIPNLQLGYLYSFSNNYGAGRVTGDYLKPFSLNKESFVFGEAHAEGWNFWNSGGSSGASGGRVNNRVDVSLGGGYRKFFGDKALIGVNGFFDNTRLTGKWYSSGSLGFQAAWLLPGSDALDLNFNWYGKLLRGREWINTFRYGPSNYDFEAGYSHEIWNGGPDLRLKIKGYHFDVGSNLNGWTAGAELKSRDGMFVLKYEAGHDRLDSTYQTIGGYLNTGFQVENLLKGESPFSAPTPIFRSPRNLSYMANQPAQRNMSQPTAVVVTQNYTSTANPTPGPTPGPCDNIDWFVETIEMEPDGGGGNGFHYPYTIVRLVPYSCLDPNDIITVEFDYSFTGGDPGPITINALVVGENNIWNYSNDISTPPPYHAYVYLNKGAPPYNNQSAFTNTSSDPYYFWLVINTTNHMTSMSITKFMVHFNQSP